jgi:hypothetical protein
MKMKKLLQAAALLGVAVWASASRPVFALPLCDSIHGTSCCPDGARTPGGPCAKLERAQGGDLEGGESRSPALAGPRFVGTMKGELRETPFPAGETPFPAGEGQAPA